MTNNGWISVEDRLPEDGKYLCCFSSLGLGWCIDVLSYASDLNSVDDWEFYNEHHGGFYDLDSEYGYYEISGVAYWRPLPEPPEEVRNYERDNDLVLQFLESRCVQSEEANIKAKDLYNAYKLWAKSEGAYVLSARKFNSEMERHPEWFERKSTSSGFVIYWGVKLKEVL